jgi:hypothetical protein
MDALPEVVENIKVTTRDGRQLKVSVEFPRLLFSIKELPNKVQVFHLTRVAIEDLIKKSYKNYNELIELFDYNGFMRELNSKGIRLNTEPSFEPKDEEEDIYWTEDEKQVNWQSSKGFWALMTCCFPRLLKKIPGPNKK